MNNTTASNSSQRIPTATSQNMTTGLGSPRHGMKQDIEDIYGKLQEHDDALSRMDQIVEKNGALADDNIKAVQASLKASLASLRDEINRKLQSLTIELAQVQKQLNVQRGEQNILAQQNKDNTKRIEILNSSVADLSAELRGEEVQTGTTF